MIITNTCGDRCNNGDNARIKHLNGRTNINTRYTTYITTIRLSYALGRKNPITMQRLSISRTSHKTTYKIWINNIVKGLANNLHSLLISDALTIKKLRLMPRLFNRLRNRLTATMNNNNLDADSTHKSDIVHQRFKIFFDFHNATA